MLVTQEAYERAKSSPSPQRKRPRLDKSVEWHQDNMKQEDLETNSVGLTETKEGMPVVLLSYVNNIASLQQVF